MRIVFPSTVIALMGMPDRGLVGAVDGAAQLPIGVALQAEHDA
jgi:hypothetical protein